jgi:hypothetical protein
MITHAMAINTSINVSLNPYYQCGGFLFNVIYPGDPANVASQPLGGTITSNFPTSDPSSPYTQVQNQTPPPSGSYNIFSGQLAFVYTKFVYLPGGASTVTINFIPGTVGGPGNQGFMWPQYVFMYAAKLS